MNAQTQIAINAAVISKQGKGIVKAAKTGWFTIELDSGDVIKARARELTLAGAIKDGYVKAGIAIYDPKRYTRHDDVRTESGRKAFDTCDKVANTLRGLPLDDQYRAAAKALGETIKALQEKYGHLNPGQQRMCLGNRMRHA